MYVCGGGEEKRKVGYMGGGEINMEWGLRVWWEKGGSGKKMKKKIKRKKIKLVLFVCSLYLIQSVKL